MNNQIFSISHLFHTLTSHHLYNFQTQTIARILNRQDTILRTPTSYGKTETASYWNQRSYDNIALERAVCFLEIKYNGF
ncbi:MAG: hypothetical protein HC903_18215 [Methylacidiphilales bacterium]|nr:hypothetical protein [Candidatus Methylacidiphilales bacterium]NJR18407.1 hypothetical protein [Calothrix sp. CSU_2_0]